jgi:outer membrane cobalamin receptor
MLPLVGLKLLRLSLTAFGVVRNALNSSYESFNGYPMPGITVTLGLRVKFEKEKP